MSLEMTFRQKLIRVGCSAAICGLSISFLIGEAVDERAKLLRSWVNDPYLLPAQYLPLRPMEVTLRGLEQTQWRDQWVAINSLPQTNPVVTTPSVAENTQRDVVAVASAAPSHIYREVRAPAAPVPAPKPETPIAAAEVEKVLASIHEATTKLAASPEKPTVREDLPSVTSTSDPKTSDTPNPEPMRIAKAPDRNQKRGPDQVLMANDSGKAWILEGRILATTTQTQEPGHFEVGMFSKIDPDGNPVGYPLPQQILPAGQTNFRLQVPARIESGYLFAEFVAAKGGKRTLVAPPVNPWVRGNQQVAELIYNPADTVSSVAAAAAHETLAASKTVSERWKVRGTVLTMFVPGQAKIPQEDVVIKVRGRKEAVRTDQNGNFSLELPRIQGTLFLEVIKPGYHPSIVSVNANDERPLRIEIASRHAMDQLSQRIGASQGSLRGILMGQAINPDGTPLRGLTAQLSVKADGPFYFDDEGQLTRDFKATGSTGRFLFLNVEAGTGYLETFVNGEAVAPVQISSVEGGELIQKTLVPVAGALKGRIFNPVDVGGKLQPLLGARVRIDGTSDWVTTDSFGAFSIGALKWMKGERIALEVTAEKFNNHRYLVNADKASASLNLFAFPAKYVSRLARSMDIDLDPYAGLVIGKISGPSLRLDALADHSTVNNARDFYFDSKGRLRGSHEMTDPRFGTYVIFNVPKGRAILQGNDSGGVMRYSEALFANPSSINIQMD